MRVIIKNLLIRFTQQIYSIVSFVIVMGDIYAIRAHDTCTVYKTVGYYHRLNNAKRQKYIFDVKSKELG